MKNIAVPLLLASSARAQRPAMKQDRAMPMPVLIADAWTDQVCTDTATGTAQTALTGADSALGTLVTERVALATAVDDAVTAKATAVTAVIAKDADILTLLATDDSAQQAELTAQSELDTAKFAEATAIAAASAALAAKTAADSAKTAAELVQTAMNTSATNAATHYSAEQAQTATLLLAKNSADAAYNTAAGEEGALQTLYNSAKVTSDASLALWTTSNTAKTAAAALKTKLTATLATAAAALDVATDGSVAKAKQTADTALALLATAAEGKRDTWVTAAKADVVAMKLWNTAETAILTAYPVHGNVNNKCDGTAQGEDTTAVSTVDLCQAKCSLLRAWTMNAGNTLPEGAISSTNAATSCYGFAFKANSCFIYGTAALVTAVSTDSDAGYQCYKRTKTGNASDLITKYGAASGSDWTAVGTALDTWATSRSLVETAYQALLMATEYKDFVTTSKNNQDGVSTSADSDTATKLNTSDTDGVATATKLTALTTKQTEIATKLAAQTAANAAKTIQDSEEAAQLAIKNLADGDKAAQDIVVTGLTTAATTADGAKTAADTASTTATTAVATKQAAFTAAQTAAATAATAVSPGVTELDALRATAATATTTLGTAVAALAAQDALIAADQVKVNAAMATHLAAIISCKEAQYDAYSTTLAAAIATRATNLTTIEGLIDAQEAAKPTRGAAGARCEKAMSNGTFRPRRDEATCAEGLCCGAARIPVGEATMIVETCQLVAATTYSYKPPRAPMATTMPAGTDYPFTCIQGAKKLAAAASALAAAVYMLA